MDIKTKAILLGVVFLIVSGCFLLCGKWGLVETILVVSAYTGCQCGWSFNTTTILHSRGYSWENWRWIQLSYYIDMVFTTRLLNRNLGQKANNIVKNTQFCYLENQIKRKIPLFTHIKWRSCVKYQIHRRKRQLFHETQTSITFKAFAELPWHNNIIFVVQDFIWISCFFMIDLHTTKIQILHDVRKIPFPHQMTSVNTLI